MSNSNQREVHSTTLDREGARLQFRLLDLLIAPLVIAIAFGTSVSVDLIAMDAADWLFGIGWPGRLAELMEGTFSLSKRQLSTVGVALALPSVIAIALSSILLGATVSRIGFQLSAFLPISHIYVTSSFLNGQFLWDIHGAHVIAVIPYWFLARISYCCGRRHLLDRRPFLLSILRITCGLTILFLVSASRFLYANYLRSLEEGFLFLSV